MLFFVHSLGLLQRLCPRREGEKYQGVKLFGGRLTALLPQIGIILYIPEPLWRAQAAFTLCQDCLGYVFVDSVSCPLTVVVVFLGAFPY